MNLKKLMIEALGTFILTFASGTSIKLVHSDQFKDASNLQGQIFFMVYLFFFPVAKGVSGCHLNPTISTGQFISSNFETIEHILLFNLHRVWQLHFYLRHIWMIKMQLNFKLKFLQYNVFQKVFVLEIIAASLVTMAYRKAYEKSTSTFIGSLLVGGSSFVAVVGTYHFTNSAVNPAVRLPLNFIDGNFSHVVELLIAPLIGGLIGSSLYQILNSKAGLNMVTGDDSVEQIEDSVENQLINEDKGGDSIVDEVIQENGQLEDNKIEPEEIKEEKIVE